MDHDLVLSAPDVTVFQAENRRERGGRAIETIADGVWGSGERICCIVFEYVNVKPLVSGVVTVGVRVGCKRTGAE